MIRRTRLRRVRGAWIEVPRRRSLLSVVLTAIRRWALR